METSLALTPLLPLPLVAVLAATATAFVALALWRRLAGWWLRALAAAALVIALLDPAIRRENRERLSDAVFVVLDRTESQGISGRPEQVAAAAGRLAEDLKALGGFEQVTVEVLNDPADDASGSMVLSELASASADVAPNRIAGAVIVTDGVLHDVGALEDFPGPVHVLLTGRPTDWDRRIEVKSAPAYAIVDEEFSLRFRIEDRGTVPEGIPATAMVRVSLNGNRPLVARVDVGREFELPVTLTRGGLNVFRLQVSGEAGELTGRNNEVVVAVNGVRDRLRVLLVSGLPYAGERTWRNLLKSDSAVDLVHFTILRPPSKSDGVPEREIALIEFPTRELFLERIDDFDLIIFDRYKFLGILPGIYIENVARYVRDGGAVLVASGPELAGAQSLYRTALSAVLPARPTALVLEEAYRPGITPHGHRHPVTEELDALSPARGDGVPMPGWGRWYRLVEAVPERGHTVMSGPEGLPLLVLDRVGDGRIAMLLSDQAWLWTRGYDGGGPQLELLRRLAHWLMKEPDLDEERLAATAVGERILVERRSMIDREPVLEVNTPDGSTFELAMTEVAPGRWSAEFAGDESGVHRVREDELTELVVLGTAAPREFEETLTRADTLAPLARATGGSVGRVHVDGVPRVRTARPGRVAHGRGWIGVTPRDAYVTTDVRRQPLAPAWIVLVVSAALTMSAWRLEGR